MRVAVRTFMQPDLDAPSVHFVPPSCACLRSRAPELKWHGRDNQRRDVVWNSSDGSAEALLLVVVGALGRNPDDLGPRELTPQWAAYKFAQS